jgi:hypothetical protein
VSLSYAPAEAAGHLATPLNGSWAARGGARPVIPPRPGDYPLSAACKTCGGPITLRHALQLEWRHAPAAPAALTDDSQSGPEQEGQRSWPAGR